MIKTFSYRGLDNPASITNEDYKGFVQNQRGSLNSLAETMVDRGDSARAKEVVMFSLNKMPDAAVPYDLGSEPGGALAADRRKGKGPRNR